jgi:hypothetical protein
MTSEATTKPGALVVRNPCVLDRIATVTNQGKARWMIIDEAFDAEKLIEFLQALIKDAGKKVFLILDNLRVHHSKLVKAWVVLSRAKDLAALSSKLSALDVFKNLTSSGVVSNHTPSSLKARVIKGAGRKSGKIDFNPKNGAFNVVLTGLDASKIDDIEAAVKKILG